MSTDKPEKKLFCVEWAGLHIRYVKAYFAEQAKELAHSDMEIEAEEIELSEVKKDSEILDCDDMVTNHLTPVFKEVDGDKEYFVEWKEHEGKKLLSLTECIPTPTDKELIEWATDEGYTAEIRPKGLFFVGDGSDIDKASMVEEYTQGYDEPLETLDFKEVQ